MRKRDYIRSINTLGTPLFFLSIIIITAIVTVVLPLIETVVVDPDNPGQTEDWKTSLYVTTYILLGVSVGVLGMSLWMMGVIEIAKVSNMERRSKRLKKLGTEKYLKIIGAQLIDQSERGNSLYVSNRIIAGKNVKLLVYKDTSTERMYCKYVPDKFVHADDAQAWGCGLSPELYKRMNIEA